MVNETRKVFVSDDSIERLEAYILMDNDSEAPTANCEECGVQIPVELTRCSECQSFLDSRD